MAKVKSANTLTACARRLGVFSAIHFEMIKSYKEEAKFLRSKVLVAERLLYSLKENIEVENDMRETCLNLAARLTHIAAQMESVAAEMELCSPNQWVNTIVESRDSIRDVKDKYPKFFKKVKK